MPDNVTPLTVNEISDLLTEKFGEAEKDVKNIDKMRDAIHNSDDPDLEGVEDEECWHQEQFIASKIAELKEYYSNPSKENLLELKSKIGNGVDPEFSLFGIAYLKEFLNKQQRNKKEEEASQILNLQERILATSDDIWKQALQKDAEKFGFVKQAPAREDYDRGAANLWYYRTLRIEGDVTKILEDMIRVREKDIEESAKIIISMGISKFMFDTGSLGQAVCKRNHLKDKGLDGYISYYHPVCCKIVKDGEAYIMRFFLSQRDDDYPNLNNPQRDLYKEFSEWQSYILEHNLSVTQVDEKIKPFKVTNWAELISKLDGKHYSFAKEHIEFPWLKEEQG